MSNAAAFTATFSDLKTIKTRSVVSFHFEVAIEQADQALSILGGLPKSGAEIHVAIARLQAPQKDPPNATALPYAAGGGAPSQAREAPSELDERPGKVDATRVQSGTIPATAVEAAHLTAKFAANRSERAKASYRMSDDGERAVTRLAMLCGESRFARFLERTLNFEPGRIDDSETCASFARLHLDITSRREIASDERAYAAFLALEAEYKLAIGQMAEIR